MTRQWRPDNGISQFQFSLRQVRLTHGDRSFGTFISSFSIVQVQLTCSILFKQWTYTLQISFSLQSLCFVFFQLCSGLVGFCPILILVDYKQNLILIHIRTLCKKHIFQITFHPGTYFDELLGTNSSHIFPVYLYIIFYYRFNNDCRHFRRSLLRSGQHPIHAQHNYRTDYSSNGSLSPQFQFMFRKE